MDRSGIRDKNLGSATLTHNILFARKFPLKLARLLTGTARRCRVSWRKRERWRTSAAKSGSTSAWSPPASRSARCVMPGNKDLGATRIVFAPRPNLVFVGHGSIVSSFRIAGWIYNYLAFWSEIRICCSDLWICGSRSVRLKYRYQDLYYFFFVSRIRIHN